MVAVWLCVQKLILYVTHSTSYFTLRRLYHYYFFDVHIFLFQMLFNAVLNQSTWLAFLRNLNLSCRAQGSFKPTAAFSFILFVYLCLDLKYWT